MLAAEILKGLKSTEAKTVPGANVLTPRQAMLDAPEAIKKNPESRLRWVNLKNPDKCRMRIMEGYVRVPVEQGGRSLGDECALFALPMEQYQAKVEAITAENNRRLKQHENEMQAAVADVVKVLRDKYGLKIDEKRLFVNE